MSTKTERISELEAELVRTKRGAKTLGEIVDWQGRAVLDATQAHHAIDETGDGDWGYVWERMAELCAKGLATEVTA